MLKKILTAGLALSLAAFGLSGCGGESGSQEGTKKVKFFADTAVKNPGDTSWLAHIKELTGLDIEVESPPATNYTERLRIMLGSGDYPDAILFRELGNDFENAAENGVLQPVNGYIEGRENLKNYIYDYSWDAMKVLEDDKIYGVPRSTMVRKDGYYIRADWLKNLGIAIPEDRTLTLSEFENILRRFTFDDPDGNGQNDTYGISSYNDPNEGMSLTVEETFRLFGWQEAEEDEGFKYMNPKYSRTDDRYKKALEYNAMLYKDGLIDPDAPTITTYVNSCERFKRGITGVVKAFPAYIDGYIAEMRQINPEADICMVTSITDENGETSVGTPYNTGMFGFFGISADTKYAQEIIDFFDLILSDSEWENTMYGIEGVAYSKEGDKRVDMPDGKIEFTRSIMRRNTDTDFYLSNSSDYVGFDTIKAALGECMQNAVVSLDNGYIPPAATGHQLLEYNTEMAKTVTKILLGEIPAKEYDKTLEGWYAAGGEDYVKQMNEHIEKTRK